MMQILAPHPYHLTYCTNIHPGEDWTQVFQNLKTYSLQLKKQLSPNAAFGIGLRLSNIASQQLLTGDTLVQFQGWLEDHNCYVFTMNGFPYGSFHHQVVKDQVYAPDWSTRDRVTYTQRLIKILATLLPDQIDGGISTVPLSYKPWFLGKTTELSDVFERSSLHLAQLAAEMAQIEAETGKLLHLDLEPEPDALLENTDDVIAFFQEWLWPTGQTYLQSEYDISASTAETWLRRHIRLCYDTCHFAVEYEDPIIALTRFQDAGITIGKFQLSSAIRIPIPSAVADRRALSQCLTPFAESTYLHQVIALHESDVVDNTSPALHHYPDLRDALPALMQTNATEWRTHFHVPIFIDRYPPLASTQDHIAAILKALPQVPHCTHLEIETYTWDVLPQEMKLDILSSIRREYEWVLTTLHQLPPV